MDAADVARMRGLLSTLAYYLDDVLSDGIPKRGRGRDAGSAHAQWIEDRSEAVKEALALLADTSDENEV